MFQNSLIGSMILKLENNTETSNYEEQTLIRKVYLLDGEYFDFFR